jgi:2-polyprenyl-3-methyl-5-hydroxy-6-metoxy-1,4-benzoquinol methylase
MVSSDSQRVLDIGCSTGELGKAIKDKYGCYVVGVDVIDSAIARAREVLDEAYSSDLGSLIGEGTLELKFDTIIFADSLEHIVDAEEVLIQAASLLAENGEIIISVPNVCHWYVIYCLLRGEWPSRSRGIFDFTHVRFFTRKSMINWLASLGLNGVYVGSNYRFFDEPGGYVNAVIKRFGSLVPLGRFLSYQVRFVVKHDGVNPS